MLDLFLLQFLFSTATPINKVLLKDIGPLTLTLLRLGLSGAILTIIWLLVERPRIQMSFAHAPLFAKKVIFGTYLKYVLKYWGLQYITPVHMALLLYSTPLWTAFYEYLFFGYVIHRRQWLGMFVACLGTTPLLLSAHDSVTFLPSHIFISLPSLAIIGAVAAHSYGTVCAKQLIMVHSYCPTFVSLSSAMGAGMLALITIFITQEPMVVREPMRTVPLLLLLVMLSSVIGKIWHGNLLKRHSSTLLAISEYLLPLFVGLQSFFLFGDGMPPLYGFTGICIVVGLCLFKSAEHQSSIIKAGSN